MRSIACRSAPSLPFGSSRARITRKEQSRGGFPLRVVARLARLDDNRAETLTAAQVVHAVHPLMLSPDPPTDAACRSVMRLVPARVRDHPGSPDLAVRGSMG